MPGLYTPLQNKERSIMSVGTVLSGVPVSHLHQDYAQQRDQFETQPW
jgi:hypothetical protein